MSDSGGDGCIGCLVVILLLMGIIYLLPDILEILAGIVALLYVWLS